MLRNRKGPAVTEAGQSAMEKPRAAADEALADKLAKRSPPHPVERAQIEQALTAHWPEGSDRTGVPLALAQKRAAQLGSLPRQAKRRRVVAYLARRGFTGRDITELVDKVV